MAKVIEGFKFKQQYLFDLAKQLFHMIDNDDGLKQEWELLNGQKIIVGTTILISMTDFNTIASYGTHHIVLKDSGIILYRDGFYQGSIKGELAHGWGRRIFKDNTFYMGFFKDGKFNGNGLQALGGSELFRGNFKGSKWADQDRGIRVYIDGKYTGGWKNQKRHGWGQMKWDNGTSFVGQWSCDRYVHGTFYKKDGTCFEGTFHNNSSKTGKLYNKNGFCVKEGRFIGDALWGYGIIRSKPGKFFLGTFINDKCRGKFKYVTDEMCCKGQFSPLGIFKSAEVKTKHGDYTITRRGDNSIIFHTDNSTIASTRYFQMRPYGRVTEWNDIGEWIEYETHSKSPRRVGMSYHYGPWGVRMVDHDKKIIITKEYVEIKGVKYCLN